MAPKMPLEMYVFLFHWFVTAAVLRKRSKLLMTEMYHLPLSQPPSSVFVSQVLETSSSFKREKTHPSNALLSAVSINDDQHIQEGLEAGREGEECRA